MKLNRLNPLDASWLYVESRQTPMHVAGLQIFKLPKGAPPDFLQKLAEEFRGAREFAPPWNQRLRSSRLLSPVHVWVEDHDLDLEYHVRHSALPKPGGERELGILISRLHSHPLDFNRPPWELHLIEGLENDRFAIYTKMHHSLIDGVSGARLMQRCMSTDPDDMDTPVFWTVRPEGRARDADARPLPTPAGVAQSLLAGLRSQARSVPELMRALGEGMGLAKRRDNPMVAPFQAPNSILNLRIKQSRRFATQQYDLARLKAIAKAADGTLNDVVLCLCAGALRRFLKEANALPAKPLTSGIPVSVRPKDDEGTGNAISFMIASLATDVADPLQRLEAIKASTRRAKEHLQSLPKSAITQYTMILMAPYILQLLSGLGGRTRPVFNVTISNVPGPEQPLYYRGARLEVLYPVSLVSHGQALNITCYSYAGKLAFGYTGCRDTLPHMQRLAVYTGDALEELELAVFGGKKKKRA